MLSLYGFHSGRAMGNKYSGLQIGIHWLVF
ncbi:cytochrome b561, partial [Salmonella enterica subsp. enterica serovar Reading]|nr:cytochrome b561 [Salmonella enterica subsp. enterica serovar Reading]